jgi:hypothetical protein
MKFINQKIIIKFYQQVQVLQLLNIQEWQQYKQQQLHQHDHEMLYEILNDDGYDLDEI